MYLERWRCSVKTSGRALWAVLTATVLFLAAAEHAAPADTPAANPSLSGQLLVAMPSLDDPRFKRTVVYMLVHDARGAMGLIMNRPLGDIPIAVLLKQAGLPDAGVKGKVQPPLGGPVGATPPPVPHSHRQPGAEDTMLADGLAVTSQPDI